MPILPDWVVQVLQVVTVLALAPLVSGVIARAEAVIQQRRGPRTANVVVVGRPSGCDDDIVPNPSA